MKLKIDFSEVEDIVDGLIEDLKEKAAKERAAKEDGLSNEVMNELIGLVRWGTYGKDGKSPLRWKALKELDAEHLENIIATQPQISSLMKRLLLFALKKCHTRTIITPR